jgi:ABC-type multidrug transport system ATPase subunit
VAGRLTADRITVRRRGRPVVRELTLAAGAGECLLVTGANGAGKTTLLRALAGVTRPSSGRLERPGPPHAYVPEKLLLAPALDVCEWVAGMRRLRGLAPVDPAELLAAADLPEAVAGRPLGALSKGQLQRVALAEALRADARLLVLDEPFAGLDGAGRGWLTRALDARLAAGAVVVVTDHSGAAGGLEREARRVPLGPTARIAGAAADPAEGGPSR